MLLSRKKLQKIRYSKRQSRKRYKKKKGGKRKKRRNKSFRKRRKALNLRRKTLKYKHKGGAGEEIVTIFPSSFVGGKINGIRLAIVTNPFETTTEFINGLLYNGKATDAAKQMYKEFQDIILYREKNTPYTSNIRAGGEFALPRPLSMADFCGFRLDVLRVQIEKPHTIDTVMAVIKKYVDVDDSVSPTDVTLDMGESKGDQPAAESKQESSQLIETKGEEVNCDKFNKAEGKYIPIGKRGSKKKKLKQVRACDKAPNCTAVKGRTPNNPHGHGHSNKGRYSCKRVPPTEENRPAEPTSIDSAVAGENEIDDHPFRDDSTPARPGPPTEDFTAMDDLVFPPDNTDADAEKQTESDEDDNEQTISRPGGEIEITNNPGCAIANEFKTDSGEWREGFPGSVPCPANRDSLDANLRGNYGTLRNRRCESKAIELRQSLQDRCSSKYGDDGNLIQEVSSEGKGDGEQEVATTSDVRGEEEDASPEGKGDGEQGNVVATGDVGAKDGERSIHEGKEAVSAIPEEEAGYFAIYVVRDSPGDRIAISDGNPDAPKFKGFVRRLRKNTEGDIFKDFTWRNLGILTPRELPNHETMISMNVRDMGFTRAQNIPDLEQISGEITTPGYVQSRTGNMLKNSGLRTCKVFAGAGDAGGARAIQGNLGGLPNNADGLPIDGRGTARDLEQDARCVIFEMPRDQIDTRGDDPNDYSLRDDGVANLQNTKTLIEHAMLSVPPAAAPAPASTGDGDPEFQAALALSRQDQIPGADIPEPTVAPPQRPIPHIDGEIVPPNIVRAPEGAMDALTGDNAAGEVCYLSSNGNSYLTMRTMNNILRNSTRLENGQWVSGLRREEGNAIQALDPYTRDPISQDAINYIRPPPGRIPDILSEGGTLDDVNLIQDNTTTIEEFLEIQGDESELTENEADYLFRWVRGNWNRYIGLSTNYRIGLIEGPQPDYYSGFVPSPPNEWEDVYFRPNTPVDREVSRAASGASSSSPVSDEGDSSNETGGTGATTDQTGDVVPVAPQVDGDGTPSTIVTAPQVDGDGTEDTARVVQPGVPNMPEAPTTVIPQPQVIGENQEENQEGDDGATLRMAESLPEAPHHPIVLPRGDNESETTPSDQPEAGRQPSSVQQPVDGSDGTGSGSGAAAAVAGNSGTGSSGTGRQPSSNQPPVDGTGSSSGAPPLPARPSGQQPGGPNPGGRPNPGGEGAPNPVAWPVPPTLPHFIVKGQMWPGDYQPQIRMWVDDGTNFSSWLRHLGQPIPIAAQPPQGPGGGGDGGGGDGRRTNNNGGNNPVPPVNTASSSAAAASSASSSNLSTSTNNAPVSENSATQTPSSGQPESGNAATEGSSTEQRPVQGPEQPPTPLNIENQDDQPNNEIPRPPSTMVNVPQPETDNNPAPSAPPLEENLVNQDDPLLQPESTDSTQLTVSARELNSQLTTIANNMDTRLNELLPQLQDAFNRGMAVQQATRIYELLMYLRQIRMTVNEQIATTLRLTEGENEESEELTNISSIIRDLPEHVQATIAEIVRILNQPENTEPEITELPDANVLEDSAPDNALEDGAAVNSATSGIVQGMATAINEHPGQPGYDEARQIAEQSQQQQQQQPPQPETALVTTEQ